MKFIEIFDTRDDGLKCVRFESGAVGVVDEQGEVVFKADRFKHIVFAENKIGFVSPARRYEAPVCCTAVENVI